MKILCDLLSHSLRLKDTKLETEAIDWLAVYQEAGRQTVVGIAFDGMQGLVESGRSAIARPLMLQWVGDVMAIERQNTVVNERMGELVGRFREAGLPFVVMKGQTVGAMYPNPMRRQSGDVDVFVWDGQSGKACQLLRELGAVAGEIAPEKHAEFEYRGVVVEVHHALLDMCCPSAMRYLETLDYSTLVEDRSVATRQVPCFKPTFNTAYMLGHMVHHLLTEGVGLRQVCDWMVQMKQLEPYIYNKVEELQWHLDGLHLQEAFSAFAQLGVDHFGLDAACWQWALWKDARKNAQTLLAFIMESGNFGRKKNAKRSSKTLWGNLANASLYLRHLLRLRHIAPSEVRWFFWTRTKRWWHKKRMA